MEIHQQEEQKNTGKQQSYAHVNSRLLFRLENQQFLQQQQNDGDSARKNGSRFDSVFDTLRVLENKDQNRAVKFKWIPSQIKQLDLLSKQTIPCQQCQSVVRANSSISQSDAGNQSLSGIATPQGFKYPKTAQTRGGWLHILKIPESNFISGDDSHQAIVLTNSLQSTAKKAYCIFVKGKLYRFESENHEKSQKVLDIKNCNMDMITIQRPDQTVAQSLSCNLEQGIQVRSLSKTYLFMSCARSDASTNHKTKDIQDWFEYFKKYGTLLNMKSYYEVGNLLGKGNFAKVYEATNFKTQEKFALKTIEKKMISKNKRNFFALLQEVTLLRRLDHKNIIHLHEVYESEHNIHLILECLNGGELFERIKRNGSYNEKDAAIIMRCILEALVAMHRKSIVHRDLKPENLLFKSEDIGSLKIVDFGLSTLIKDSPLNMRCGSPGYVAPEILNDLGYGCKVDIFSAGIILYILLTGKFVFSGRNYREILMKNKECLVPFPPQYWTNLTAEAKDLVKKMLEKDPKSRLSAEQALQHPWFTSNRNNLQNLELNFEEVDDLQLTDEEPSLANSVNLKMITSSPIWNKSRMRDEVRKVNAEQDKRNTFTTPMPQPKFIGARRLEPHGQRKELKGIVVQNLFNNNQSQNPEPQQNMQQLKKQHQTPLVNSSSQQRVQNTTQNMLYQLYKKADQAESAQIEKEDKNSAGQQEILIKEEQKINDPNVSIHNQSQDVKINYGNLNYSQNQSYGKSQQQENTQTSTPNQQHHGLSQQQMDQNYERIMRKWQEPNFLALSRIMEDAALEDAKSQLMMLGSQINPNDPNYEEIKKKVMALRQYSEQQTQGKMIFENRLNHAPGQSMHHLQIHNFLMNDIPINAQQNPQPAYNGPVPYFPGQAIANQARLVSHSPNISSKYSPSQIKNSLPVIREEGQVRKYVKQKNEARKNQQEEDDESFGDLEIEENADRSLDFNKIVDFNAHSNNCLLKSSTVETKNNGGFSFQDPINPIISSQDRTSPNKQVVDDSDPSNVRPGNPSSLSVNSNSYFANSRLSNNGNGNKSDSSGNKSQQESNSNSNPLSQFSNSQSSQPVHRYSLPKAQQSQNKKSQFFANSINPIVDGEETPNGEEANVEGHIDIEEQPANLIFYVPTTPGSIYGGSRNIMRHSINNVQGPLHKYLDMNAAHNKNLLALNTQNNNNFSSGKFSIGQMGYNQTAGNYPQYSDKNLNTNPMNQSGKSSQNQGYSKPIDFQQNPTFNGSQYFQKDGMNSKPNLSQAQLYRLQTNQNGNDEEVKEEQSPAGFPDLAQNNFESSAKPFGQSITPNSSADQRKKVQILNMLRQEDKNISQSSDNARSGTSNLPEVESNEQLQKQLKDLRSSFTQSKMITETMKQTKPLQVGSNELQNLNGSINGSLNPYTFSDQTPAKSAGIINRESMSGQNPFFSAYGGSDMQRFGSAQVSGNGDDKSARDYQTAYQSMVDLHEMQKQQNSISANGGLSWQGQHSSANNNSQKSFIDMTNKDCQNQILTEQDILNQNNQASGGGSELERVNNYSQEILKPQNSYNLGEFRNQRQTQVNNLRKTLKNQI